MDFVIYPLNIILMWIDSPLNKVQISIVDLQSRTPIKINKT